MATAITIQMVWWPGPLKDQAHSDEVDRGRGHHQGNQDVDAHEISGRLR